MPRPHHQSTTFSSPFAGAGPRLASLIAMLIALGLIYSHARKPETWRWLVNQKQPVAAQANAEPLPPVAPFETVVPGPNDLDQAEMTEAERLFQAIDDKTELSAVEMPAYWQLVKWSRAQSFAEMEARAKRDVTFAQVFQHPEEHRGELIRLDLHVRQVVDFPPRGENKLGVSRIYEAWGATDDSKSHPYVVIFTDPPPGLPMGQGVKAEAVFVGYFLKTMSYLAGDVRRASPLLIGRLRLTTPAVSAPARPALSQLQTWLLIVGGAVIVGIGIWRMRRPSRPRPAPPTAAKEAELANWLGSHGEESDGSPSEFPERT